MTALDLSFSQQVPLRLHAAHQAMPDQQRLVLSAGVLRAPDRMRGQSMRWLSLNDRHSCNHGPARNFLRVQVQHDRQIPPAATRADVGAARDPDQVGQGLSNVY